MTFGDEPEKARVEDAAKAEPTCPHNRVTISRKHGAWVRHSFFQGRHQASRPIIGDSNGTIMVHCFDCDYERKFTASQEKPPWVLALLAQME
jgi:hypothetical protein